MSKTFKIILGATIGIMFAVALFSATNASAADYTIDRLTVKDLAHFDRNYDGWWETGSEIYDNNDLVIASDDNIDIWAPQQARFRSDAYWRRNYDGWDGTNSRIFDNNDMHVATDDFLFLDVPVKVIVQNHMDVMGTLQVFGLTVANGTVDFTNAGTVLLPSLTINGDVDMNGYSVLELNNIDMSGVVENTTAGGYITIADGLDLQGNLWNSTSSVNINDAFVVTGTSDLRGAVSNSTGDLVFDDVSDFRNSLWSSTGNFTISDFLTVDSLSYLNGGININGGATIIDTAGNIFTQGHLDVRGDLYDGSAGPLTINDSLVQSGSGNQVTFNGNVDALNGLDVTGDISVSAGNGLDTIAAGTLNIGLTNATTIQLGNAGTILSFSGSILGHLLPSADNTYDIGASPGYRWQDAYFSNSVNIGSTLVLTDTGISDDTGDLNLNDYVNVANDLTVSGGSYLNGGVSVDGAFLVADTSGDVSTTGTFASDSANFGGGYGSMGASITNAGNLSMNGNLVVDGSGLFSGMVMADTGIDTSAAGTPLYLGGTTANLVYLDAVTTLNIGTSNAVNINIGQNGVSTTTIDGSLVLPNAATSISGAGSGSGLDADMVDGQHISDTFAFNTGALLNVDGVYAGMGWGANEVICNHVSGLASVTTATATAEDMVHSGPFTPGVYSVNVISTVGMTTPGAVCPPLNPGEVHLIITVPPSLVGVSIPPGPFAATSVKVNVHASQ